MSRVEGSEEQHNKPSPYQVSTNICHQQRSDLNSLSNWYSIHSAYKGSHTFNHSVACCKVQLEIVSPVRWPSSYLTSFRCAGTCVGECVQVYVCGCVCMCMGPLLIASNAATLLAAAVTLLIAATLCNIM